jgi:cyclin-A
VFGWVGGGRRKYEEISPPHVEDFCYITDNTYTKDELLQMEGDILKLLQFELGNPTIKTFLRWHTYSIKSSYFFCHCLYSI